jgi:hypothetical protein
MKSLINVSVVDWAEQCSKSTYLDLTQEQRDEIIRALMTYVKHPFAFDDETDFDVHGYFVNLLLPTFSREKAELVATTEITRIWAYFAQLGGEGMKNFYLPMDAINLKFLKIWNSRNDSEVCPICKGLEGKEVKIHDSFSEGIFIPPAHEGCRCWIITTNYSIADLDKLSRQPSH